MGGSVHKKWIDHLKAQELPERKEYFHRVTYSLFFSDLIDMVRELDVGWNYGTPVDGNKQHSKCNYCNKTIRGGGVSRLKRHLAGICGDVERCQECPDDIKQAMLNVLRTAKKNKSRKHAREDDVHCVPYAGEGEESHDHLQIIVSDPQSSKRKKRGPQVAQHVGSWRKFPIAKSVQQMMETMDRIMVDPLAYRSSGPPASPRENGVGGYMGGRIPWEIKVIGEDSYKMRFDMPGMTKSDVKVCVEGKDLVVKAAKVPKISNEETKNEEDDEEEEYDDEEEGWSVKSFGTYHSKIELPENVEFEKIKAVVKDGVLYITIPKLNPKKLDINVQ